MRLNIALFIGVLGASVVPEAAHAATFWCDRADHSTLNVTELTICETPDLRALDLHMEGLYLDLKASADAPEKRRLTDEQTQKWRLFRDTCGGDADCLIARYAYRIHELSGQPAPLGGTGGSTAEFNLDAGDIAAAQAPVPYSDAFSHVSDVYLRNTSATGTGKPKRVNPSNNFDPTASTDAFLWMIAWAESRSIEMDEFFARSLTPEQVGLLSSSAPDGNALKKLDFQLRVLGGLDIGQ